MKTRKHLLFYAAVVAFAALLAATEVRALDLPQSCTAGDYIISLVKPVENIGGGVYRYRYSYAPKPDTNPSPLSLGVVVVSRPVTPEDIKNTPPDTTTNYCQPDAITNRINFGNCDGFANVIYPSSERYFDLLSTRNTRDIVTWSLVNITGISLIINTCQNGIEGPGGLDPFQPVSQTQTVLVAGGKCYVDQVFVNGQLSDLVNARPAPGFEGTNCTIGTGPLYVGGLEIRNNTSPNGITFGNNTTTCYGPPVPRTPRCVCTITSATDTCP